MSDGAIRLHDLGHWFTPGDWIFRHCDALIERGRIFAVLGPNGCGKTTLLRTILGAVTPREGRTEIGLPLGSVPQTMAATFAYRAVDLVLMGRARHVGLLRVPARRDEAAAMQALEQLGIAHLAHRPLDAMSGGQRQLVLLARALASEAQGLVLDEPSSALDLANQGVILSLMRKLSREQGHTIVFSTHHPQHAYAVADVTLLMMASGHHVVGPTGEVMSEANLHALYGVELKRVRFRHDGREIETFVPLY